MTISTTDKEIVRRPTRKEKGIGLKSSRSLIISPNLDALLEYDEKIRGATSPTSQLPTSTPLVGLPPPPRRKLRKPNSPTSPKVGSPLIQESSQWQEDENPYINPTPEFGDVPGESGAETDVTLTIGPAVIDGPGENKKGSEHARKRVDKVLGIGKLLFTDAQRKTQQLGDVSSTSPTQRLNLREQERAKGKLLKLKETKDRLPGTSNKKMGPGQANDDLVLDIRRHSTDRDVPRRPFLSHRRPLSQGSTSSCGHSSISTDEPASTIDTRISISSTMYPTSTVHSPTVPVYESRLLDPPTRSQSLTYSFIDIISPDVSEFTIPDQPQPPSPPRPSDAKPTTPKPNFEYPPRSHSLPPAANFLDLDERNDLIRKNRKLAKVFGKPPGPDVLPSQKNRKPPVLPPITASHRHAFIIPSLDDIVRHHGIWLPMPDVVTRSHSAPLSPDDDIFFDQPNNHESQKTSHPPDPVVLAPVAIRPSSPTSFIDLSDDLGSATLPGPKDVAVLVRGRPRRPSFPSAQSLFEPMSQEEQAEEARKRKREKLARLHRFLGSRVPTNLVLGPDITDPGLPPLDFDTMSPAPETRKDWLRRRRSSSAAAYSSTWSDEVDRIKEDLNSEEKAINVRRAQKMEKVFGVAPPQTLYHTRRSPSPSVPVTNTAAITGQKSISGWMSPGENQLPVIGLRNINRTSYKKNKDNRPGTSESDKALLPKSRDSSKESGTRRRTSVVYSHYQDSLNSLNDIIDRDDKESLAELHEYLNSGDMSVPPPLQPFARSPPVNDRRLSNASIKSERRRSLPARTSIISISSEHSVATPRPEVTDFQARRRRAAKLTQFFGVNYRELITDVLESIESGLEHERKRGTLDPDEVEDLLARLRKLRTKRTGVF